MTADSGPTVVETKRRLDVALASLEQPGAGAIGTLECQIGTLQEAMVATPARSLADIEARLQMIGELVATLGPRGYLAQLVEATLADVKALQATAGQAQDLPGD